MELEYCFTCPVCGWSLEGNDSIYMYSKSDSCHDPAEFRFNYCFHCGCKMKEPDTIEAIESDAKKSASGYWGCDCDCEQCSAEIDGKKPCERYGVGDCLSAQTIDLLRRQRKVLSHGGDGHTCRNSGGEEGTNGEGYDFACSACGFLCDQPDSNYCPNCGAKVVEE